MSSAAQVISSETSVSVAQPKQTLWTLLRFFIVLVLVIEGLTRFMHQHREMSLSIENELNDALAIRRNESRQQILFAGNSLIFEGLSRPVIQERLGAGFVAHTAGVPGSTFHDWQYGLRSLFQRGGQPDVVVFGISPSQFIRASATTAQPVAQLWRTRDIYSYFLEQRPTLTAASDLIFEHYSTYFSMRDTLRIHVRKYIPGFKSMIGEWTQSEAHLPSSGQDKELIEAKMLERLAALQAECKDHARLIVLIVPTDQTEDEAAEPALRAAAIKLGVPLIEPIGEREWPVTKFQSDGYHLNTAAATEFSRMTGDGLTHLLDKPATKPTVAELHASAGQ